MNNENWWKKLLTSLLTIIFALSQTGMTARTLPSAPGGPSQQAIKVKDGKLYIGARYNEQYDLLITFSKCMFNHLMTFSQVGLATNSGNAPLPNPDRPVESMLNQAFSDNIGPFSITGHGWCGANHSYMDQNQIRTAENISYSFSADGKALEEGDAGYARKVQVSVKNRIYNPTFPPAEGAEILSSELCIEEADYLIEDGGILVKVRHTFTNPVPVTLHVYYGMQSMFWQETGIMTPQGIYPDFEDATPNQTFYKKDYPEFRRYIERRKDTRNFGPDGKMLYQSSYLLPENEGTHRQLTESSRIFTHSYGKCYHVLLEDLEAAAGFRTKWCGLYNWPEPIQDNDVALVYTAKAKGRDYLFIDLKQAAGDLKIPFPDHLKGKRCKVSEKAGNIVRIQKNRKQIVLSSSGPGSVILIF